MKHLILADDLSNQSLFGFRRSLRLKQISLQFCYRIGADLKIIHVDSPKSFQYQEPLYKKYLDYTKLNRKIRYETLPEGIKVKVEYLLEEGEPIATLAKALEKGPTPVGIIAGTSNRFRMGAFRIGSRTKGLVAATQLPVFIFGIGAIKNFDYHAKEEFRITLVVDSGVMTDFQIKTLKSIATLYKAKLDIVVFGTHARWLRKLSRFVGSFFRKPPSTNDMKKLKSVFPDASFRQLKSGFSLRRSLLKEMRGSRPHVIAVPEDFSISPFAIARRSKIPVVPLRGL